MSKPAPGSFRRAEPVEDLWLTRLLTDAIRDGLDRKGWSYERLEQEIGAGSGVVGRLLNARRQGSPKVWSAMLQAVGVRFTAYFLDAPYGSELPPGKRPRV